MNERDRCHREASRLIYFNFDQVTNLGLLHDLSLRNPSYRCYRYFNARATDYSLRAPLGALYLLNYYEKDRCRTHYATFRP